MQKENGYYLYINNIIEWSIHIYLVTKNIGPKKWKIIDPYFIGFTKLFEWCFLLFTPFCFPPVKRYLNYASDDMMKHLSSDIGALFLRRDVNSRDHSRFMSVLLLGS